MNVAFFTNNLIISSDMFENALRGPPFNIQGGGGLEFLSRANYLFQPDSAARWKFQIVLHVYIEQFLK